MKILHTSDWHLGHMLYNKDRTEEQQAMLDQMVEIVAKEKPDVFILAGDVYDTAQPDAEVQTMLTEAIVKLHDANPSMHLIITAGNHDNGAKHDVFKTPWKILKVHTIGQFNKKHLDNCIIPIPCMGYVIAIPHTRSLTVELVQEMCKRVNEMNTDNLPVIMTAHTTIQGGIFTGHKQIDEKIVGGIEAIDIAQFGDGYDYLALGHIHKPQFIHTGKHNVRYSGTPIPVSFDETYEHSVTLLEISHHGETLTEDNFRFIPIHNPHNLVTLPPTGTATWEEAIELLSTFLKENHESSYIRLNIEVNNYLPESVKETARKMVKDDGKHLWCPINVTCKEKEEGEIHAFTVQEFQEKEPIEIAKLYAEYKGVNFDEDMVQMFREAETYQPQKED